MNVRARADEDAAAERGRAEKRGRSWRPWRRGIRGEARGRFARRGRRRIWRARRPCPRATFMVTLEEGRRLGYRHSDDERRIRDAAARAHGCHRGGRRTYAEGRGGPARGRRLFYGRCRSARAGRLALAETSAKDDELERSRLVPRRGAARRSGAECARGLGVGGR